MTDARPFADLRPTGLLWLINTTVFHPRGYALALVVDDGGNATGWRLIGDGSEPWVMPDGECDPLFRAASELLKAQPRLSTQIYINSRPMTLTSDSLSYEEITGLAGLPEGALPTVVYRTHGGSAGSLTPGQSVALSPDMVIDAVVTGNA